MSKKNKSHPKKNKLSRFIGLLERVHSGKGYVFVKELDVDIVIPKHYIKNARNKDLVEVTILPTYQSSKIEGKILSIKKRYKTQLTGTLRVENNQYRFKPTDHHINYAISLENFDPIKHLTNYKIIVKIVDWGTLSANPIGRIVKSIGKQRTLDAEIQSILIENELDDTFDKSIETYIDENIKSEITTKEIKHRQDFRQTLTFTIDPTDAKDFDDALSYRKLKSGEFEVGVHIADVSHYVTPQSPLDIAALKRGNSVYLVDRVIHMLPKVLSNKICSLRPYEDKLTFSAVFKISKDFKIKTVDFSKSIIHSDFRFSYEEVQHLIETNSNTIPKSIALSKQNYNIDSNVLSAILNLNKIARFHRRQRFNNGSIDFDKIEVGFQLDKSNFPISVLFKESKDAHKLIEEFMLLANRYVAQKFNENKKNTYLYRIHDNPDENKLTDLNNIIQQFGYSLNLSSRKKINQSLNQVLSISKGKKEHNMISNLTIKSMSKAIYSTNNIGHYGLAFNHYTHFTSPIRRYSDLITHRLLENSLLKKPINISNLEDICEQCTQMSIQAKVAERQSIKYMQILFMKDKENKNFKGIISGVVERGIFVELIENKCEGFVNLKDLKDDFYLFYPKEHLLKGKRKKRILQIGNEVSIRVKEVDIDKRHLNLLLN